MLNPIDPNHLILTSTKTSKKRLRPLPTSQLQIQQNSPGLKGQVTSRMRMGGTSAYGRYPEIPMEFGSMVKGMAFL